MSFFKKFRMWVGLFFWKNTTIEIVSLFVLPLVGITLFPVFFKIRSCFILIFAILFNIPLILYILAIRNPYKNLKIALYQAEIFVDNHELSKSEYLIFCAIRALAIQFQKPTKITKWLKIQSDLIDEKENLKQLKKTKSDLSENIQKTQNEINTLEIKLLNEI